MSSSLCSVRASGSHAADVHGLEHGVRGSARLSARRSPRWPRARSSPGVGGNLKATRPARLAADDAEPPLQIERVDLDHDAVGRRSRAARVTHARVWQTARPRRCREALDVRIHLNPVPQQQQRPSGRWAEPTVGPAQQYTEHVERPARRDPTSPAGGRRPRRSCVDSRRAARRLRHARVELLEPARAHEDLAAHLDTGAAASGFRPSGWTGSCAGSA